MKQLFYILLLIHCSSFAQQDAIYSQYMFNPFAINPAYAGSRKAVNVVAINRSQWLGLSGSPLTQTVSAHLPASKNNLAWGINLSHDKLGPITNLLALATVAYQLKLHNGTLNFGLRSGIYNSVLNGNQLNFREENDALDLQQRLSSIVPTFDFGVYYYTNRFYFGASINHLTQQPFNFNGFENNQMYYLRRHLFASTGYVFEVNSNLLLKPSVLIKYSEGVPLNVDFNVNAMFNELFWLGIGFRNLSSLNFLIDINVTDYMRIGYAYDLTLNKIKAFSYGSHELLLGFDFNLNKRTPISPRHL